MKRIAFALGIVGFSGSLTGCASLSDVLKATGFQSPTLQFESAEYVAANFQKLRTNLRFQIHNPNSIGAKVDGYRLKFAIDGLTLVDGDVNEAMDLQGGQTTSFVVPAVIEWAQVAQKLSQGIPADLPWTASGAVRFDTPIGPIELPFGLDGKLPVIQPPLIVPAGLRIGSVSLKGLEIFVDLDVVNQSARIFGFTSLSHAIEISGHPIISGNLASPGDIGAEGKKTHTLRSQLSFLGAAGAIARALQGKQATTVAVQGAINVDTGFGVVPFAFNTSKDLVPGSK